MSLWAETYLHGLSAWRWRVGGRGRRTRRRRSSPPRWPSPACDVGVNYMWMKKCLVNNLLRRQLHCSGQNVDMPVEGRLGGGGEGFLESCLFGRWNNLAIASPGVGANIVGERAEQVALLQLAQLLRCLGTNWDRIWSGRGWVKEHLLVLIHVPVFVTDF